MHALGTGVGNTNPAENWEKLCGEIDKNLAENCLLIFGKVMGI